MDNKEEIKIITQKEDKRGNIVEQVYHRFVDGKRFATVFCKVYGTPSGLRRLTRTVFSEPQENFECEFGEKMTVKMIEERCDVATGRVCERAYVNLSNEMFSRDYLTGQCKYRANGVTMKSSIPAHAAMLMRWTNRRLSNS